MHPIQELFKDLQDSSKEEIIENIKKVKISKSVLFIAMIARTEKGSG